MRNKVKQVRQRGAVTLLMATVMLFTITLVSFYGAKMGVMEQKISANHYRATQAYEAAQAGLDEAMTQLDKAAIAAAAGGGAANGTIGPNVLNDAGGNRIGDYTVAYQTVAAGNYDRLSVTVTANSGDGSSQRTFSQLLDFIPFVNNPPPGAVVAHGTVNLTSNQPTLTNNSADWDVAAWSGGAATVSGPANTATGSGGDGIYDQDSALAGLSNDGFFENFFSEGKQAVRQTAQRIDCTSGCTESDLKSQITGTPQVVWVDGDLDIGNFTLGTAANPVILIVDGNFTMSHASATVNGVLYTTQDWNNGANKGNVNGSVLVEGNFSASGKLDITYDQAILDSIATNGGVYVGVPGSWRD